MRLPLDLQYAAMPWDEIDAVVFDVGNVLVPYNPDMLLQEHCPDHPEFHSLLKELIFQSPYWLMLDRGQISYEEALELMSRTHPEHKTMIAHILRSWIDTSHTLPEGVAVLEKCAAMGKKLYVLSNYNNHAFETMRQKHDFWKHVSGFLISADVGLLKPDLAIYERLISDFFLTPSRTVFIDDSVVNIEAALHCGIQGICYRRPGQLQEFFGL